MEGVGFATIRAAIREVGNGVTTRDNQLIVPLCYRLP